MASLWPRFAAEIRKKRIEGGRSSKWRWDVDEVFVKINGETHYLWRAVDHEGEVLESYVTKRRDKKAALKFIRKSMRRHGQTDALTTDRLRSYGAALKHLGAEQLQECGRYLNNRMENSHLPFRRRERSMLRFRLMRSLQKFVAVQASFYNHFKTRSMMNLSMIGALGKMHEWEIHCKGAIKTGSHMKRYGRSSM